MKNIFLRRLIVNPKLNIVTELLSYYFQEAVCTKYNDKTLYSTNGMLWSLYCLQIVYRRMNLLYLLWVKDKCIFTFSHILCEASRGGCLCVQKASLGSWLGTNLGG